MNLINDEFPEDYAELLFTLVDGENYDGLDFLIDHGEVPFSLHWLDHASGEMLHYIHEKITLTPENFYAVWDEGAEITIGDVEKIHFFANLGIDKEHVLSSGMLTYVATGNNGQPTSLQLLLALMISFDISAQEVDDFIYSDE